LAPIHKKNIDALKKADWLVVCEIYPDETSEFWKSPGISQDMNRFRPRSTVCGRGLRGEGRHVRQFGALAAMERRGAAAAGAGQTGPEILARIFLKVRELYQAEGGKFLTPFFHASWNYTDPLNPSLAEVAKEINGRALADVTDSKLNQTIKAYQQLPGFGWLRDDGSP
jgi:formate dehydrogenase major subunit